MLAHKTGITPGTVSEGASACWCCGFRAASTSPCCGKGRQEEDAQPRIHISAVEPKMFPCLSPELCRDHLLYIPAAFPVTFIPYRILPSPSFSCPSAWVTTYSVTSSCSIRLWCHLDAFCHAALLLIVLTWLVSSHSGLSSCRMMDVGAGTLSTPGGAHRCPSAGRICDVLWASSCAGELRLGRRPGHKPRQPKQVSGKGLKCRRPATRVALLHRGCVWMKLVWSTWWGSEQCEFFSGGVVCPTLLL